VITQEAIDEANETLEQARVLREQADDFLESSRKLIADAKSQQQAVNEMLTRHAELTARAEFLLSDRPLQ